MSIGYRTRCESLLRKSSNKMDSHHQVWARWEAGSGRVTVLDLSQPKANQAAWEANGHGQNICHLSV